MILALLSLTFSITQVVATKDVISENKRFIVGLTFALVSAIPVLLQLVTLVQELWRVGRYCLKLLFQRFILTCLGDYAQGLSLVLMHRDALNTAMTSLIEGQAHPLDSLTGGSLVNGALRHLFPAGWLTFRDAFSGQYQYKIKSVALWMTGEAEPWETWYNGIEPLDEDVWKGSKEIRDAEVFWRFGRVSDPTEDVPRKGSSSANHGGGDNGSTGDRASPGGDRFVRVPAWTQGFGPEFARATRDNSKAGLSGFVGVKPKEGSGFLSKLSYYNAVGFYATSEENYRTFCNLMKAVDDHTYFVSLDDTELLDKVKREEYDLTLHCLDLNTVLTSILEKGKKVRGRILYKTCYV